MNEEVLSRPRTEEKSLPAEETPPVQVGDMAPCGLGWTKSQGAGLEKWSGEGRRWAAFRRSGLHAEKGRECFLLLYRQNEYRYSVTDGNW